MPSTFQSGESDDYENSYERQLDLWPEDWLTILEPMTLEAAKGYLGAANKMGCSTEVKEHFAECASRLRQSENG